MEPKLRFNLILFALLLAGGLFANSAAAKSGDAIGIRVMKNPKRLSPVAWYLENVPRPGRPEVIEIAGYPAIRDGRTVYVAATNLTGELFANIYLISHTEDADEETISVFNQLLETWRFNINIGELLDRERLKRDMKRIASLNDMLRLLENHHNVTGRFPNLEAGSFIKQLSFSVWPSWQATLGNQLGTALPVDPINEFRGCVPPFDSITCWDEASSRFMCPPESRVFAYQSNPEGTEVKLFTNFEYTGPGTWQTGEFTTIVSGSCFTFLAGLQTDLDGDTILNDVDNCLETHNPDQADADGDGVGDACDVCLTDPTNDIDRDGVCGNLDNCSTINNRDQRDLDNDGIGDACDAQTCGNSRREGAEECDKLSGVRAHQVCSNDCKLIQLTYCGDNVVQDLNDEGGAEECDGGTSTITCTVQPGGYQGIRNRSCGNDCRWVFTSDCISNQFCGNGVTEGEEECDSNTESRACELGNGYGASQLRVCRPDCRWSPFGFCTPTQFCGDNKINGFEICDNGSRNGKGCRPEYAQTCDYCTEQCVVKTLSGPFCGDDVVNGPEECDGSGGFGTGPQDQYACSEQCTWTGGWLSDGIVNGPEQCDGEAGITSGINRCVNGRLVQLLRCGDGIVQTPNEFGFFEKCDDGNNANGDGCSSSCTVENLTKSTNFTMFADQSTVVSVTGDAYTAPIFLLESVNVPFGKLTYWYTGTFDAYFKGFRVAREAVSVCSTHKNSNARCWNVCATINKNFGGIEADRLRISPAWTVCSWTATVKPGGVGSTTVRTTEGAIRIGQVSNYISIQGDVRSVTLRPPDNPQVLMWLGNESSFEKRSTNLPEDGVFACVDANRNLKCDFDEFGFGS